MVQGLWVNVHLMKEDLIVLSADRSAKAMIEAVLHRFPKTLGTKPFTFKVAVHELRDPGCYAQGVSKLDEYANHYAYCILIFDHEGSGAERKTATEIEHELEKQLSNGLWLDRNAVIVIEPELENWVWTDSVHTSTAFGWGNDREALKAWLIAQKWLQPNTSKPIRPKEAMEAAIKLKLKAPISSETFQAIAAKASFKSCTSPSFIKFKDTIVRWFTPETP